jgi:hypothetical protein
MLFAACWDENFNACDLSLHPRLRAAPCHCRARRGSVPPPRPLAPSHDPQLRTAALHLCLRVTPCHRHGRRGSTPPPAAPCSVPLATAAGSRTAALHPLRRAAPWIHAPPAADPPSGEGEGRVVWEGRAGVAPRLREPSRCGRSTEN